MLDSRLVSVKAGRKRGRALGASLTAKGPLPRLPPRRYLLRDAGDCTDLS
jgi:hypothetical protein